MTRNLLTAEQAALRLGVRLSTVYAYVSRGVLGRTLANDGRSSRFDPAEVDVLARRGRPRHGAARAGHVDVSLATSVTWVEADRLSFRGHDATRLAEEASFEQVAELLWTGQLPPRAEFNIPRDALRVVRALNRALPPSSGAIHRFAAAAAATAPLFPLRVDLRPGAVLAAARGLIATFVMALPLVARGASLEPASIAQRLWPRLSTLPPLPNHVRLLDAMLALLADHELATSTMAVRVAASTRADPFAVVLSGLGALSGPLHGSASLLCHRMLLDAAASTPDLAVARALSTQSLAGFGHPVYRDEDPRAVHLLAAVRALASRKEHTLIEHVIAAAGAASGAKPNVDLAVGAVALVSGMELGATDAIFCLARTAGWIAHALEEYSEEPLRFRARAIYIGPEVVPSSSAARPSQRPARPAKSGITVPVTGAANKSSGARRV